MSLEKLSTEPSLERLEEMRLRTCWLEGTCPHCGDGVPENHANDHFGFCEESYLRGYEKEHQTIDVRMAHHQVRAQQYQEQYQQRTGSQQQAG